MPGSSYRDWLTSVTPAWIRDPSADSFPRAEGDGLDDVLERAKAAVRSRLPIADQAFVPAADALNAIGAERQLERGGANYGGVGVAETDANFRARLANAWATWVYGGTANGLLQALWEKGYRSAKLEIVNSLQYSLDGGRNLVLTPLAPGSWSLGNRWNWFDVLFSTPNLPTPATGAPSDWTGALPGANSDEMNAIRRLIARWKPAVAVCNSIIVITGGASWGFPTGQYWRFDPWSAALTVAVGQVVVPTVDNGHQYICTATSGDAHTGGVEPVWPVGAGSSIVDNHVTWTENGAPETWGGDAQTVYAP